MTHRLTNKRARRSRQVVWMIVFAVLGLAATIWWEKSSPAQDASTPSQPPVVLAADTPGAVAAKTGDEKEERLPTRTVGSHVFRAVAEIGPEDELKPGDKVDISIASLGDEGAHENRIMRNIVLYSIDMPKGGSAEPDEETSGESDGDAEEGETDGEEEEAGPLPQRVVGLLVNGPQLETLRLASAQGVLRLHPSPPAPSGGPFGQVLHNFTSNLFQPLLLFFFLGFAVPLLKVPFEFPKVLYESLTIYLLVAIGWHGGELMAQQSPSELAIAGGLVVVGFIVNGFIGISATKILQWFTPMRRIDAATVGAYYGSDSAGTFVTCLGILATLGILHDSYMPVLLAVMEIPGCLVGLFLVSQLRRGGMDAQGNMPDEAGYTKPAGDGEKAHSIFSWKIAHEVLLNPGLFLLFGGIIVGFISGLQAIEDPHVVEGPNHLFIFIFKGALCLFLLEMGMTACKRLGDLKKAGWGFIAFGLLAPNLFAAIGMLALHGYALLLGHEFYLGTYALFAVLCAAASYIAVPAVQRLAIPEASPTLPLAASLGLTFTWNVTLGIPIYIEIAKAITTAMPIS